MIQHKIIFTLILSIFSSEFINAQCNDSILFIHYGKLIKTEDTVYVFGSSTCYISSCVIISKSNTPKVIITNYQDENPKPLIVITRTLEPYRNIYFDSLTYREFLKMEKERTIPLSSHKWRNFIMVVYKGKLVFSSSYWSPTKYEKDINQHNKLYYEIHESAAEIVKEKIIDQK
jgi:hypothetical protein